MAPEIFGVTESWLCDNINSAEISYPWYVVYLQDRVDINKGFCCMSKKVLSGLNYKALTKLLVQLLV